MPKKGMLERINPTERSGTFYHPKASKLNF